GWSVPSLQASMSRNASTLAPPAWAADNRAMLFSRQKKARTRRAGGDMYESNLRVKAFVAGLVAEAIRELAPTERDLAAAELRWPHDRKHVMQELERLANPHLAEAMRLESM